MYFAVMDELYVSRQDEGKLKLNYDSVEKMQYCCVWVLQKDALHCSTVGTQLIGWVLEPLQVALLYKACLPPSYGKTSGVNCLM